MKSTIILGVILTLIAGEASAQIMGMREVVTGYTTGRARAENENAKFLPPGNPLQQKAAVQLAAEAGVKCNATSAAVLNEKYRGGGHDITYELACKDDFGWIVSRIGNKLSAYDCLALAASEKMARGKLATCRLAENSAATAGLANLAQKAGLSCKPVQGNYLGGGGQPAISRYEVLCDNGAGYIIDAPQPKSTAGMLAMSCARAKTAGMGACTLKPEKG